MKTKKKIIGIDINEILRSRWLQFDRYYVEEFDEEGVPEIPYVYDFWNNYVWEDAEETIELLIEDEGLEHDISELDYIKEDGEEKSKAEEILFKKEVIKYSAREVFKRFMYETYVFEIFGSAPKMYKRVDYDLDLFYKKFSKEFEFKIVSKENWFTIPPTLFFLSKITPRIKKYVFAESNEEIWNEVDVLITTDPELLESPKGKTSIKLNRPYNEDLKGDYEVINFIDLIKDKEFISMIGYVGESETAISKESNGETKPNVDDK